MKTKFLLLISTIILLTSIALAAHVIMVSTSTTADGTTSYSVNESVVFTYNISVNNSNLGQPSNITSVNITLPAGFTFVAGSNGTNSTHNTSFVNISNVLSWTNGTEGYVVNGSERMVFWFNATATIPGKHNITVNTTNHENGSFETNITVEVNDTTPLASFGANPVNAKNSATASITFDFKCAHGYPYNLNTSQLWGNWSGAWALNTTNVTSILNDTYSNITLSLTEGSWKWAIFCNDSINNSDWTNLNRTLIVDLTDPTPSASCTGTDIRAGDTITCSCSGTDTLSGISTTTSSSTPETSGLSGVQTYSCTATDNAGNSASTTATYTVNAGGSSGEGGGTTPSWTRTHTVTEEQFTNSFTKEIQVKQRLRVRINDQDHHVGITELTTSTATIEIASDPQIATLSIGDERKFEVTGDSYYDIFVKLNAITNDKADITIQSINELITEESIAEQEERESTAEEEKESATKTSKIYSWTIGIIVAIVIIVVLIAFQKKKKSTKK